MNLLHTTCWRKVNSFLYFLLNSIYNLLVFRLVCVFNVFVNVELRFYRLFIIFILLYFYWHVFNFLNFDIDDLFYCLLLFISWNYNLFLSLGCWRNVGFLIILFMLRLWYFLCISCLCDLLLCIGLGFWCRLSGFQYLIFQKFILTLFYPFIIIILRLC